MKVKAFEEVKYCISGPTDGENDSDDQNHQGDSFPYLQYNLKRHDKLVAFSVSLFHKSIFCFLSERSSQQSKKKPNSQDPCCTLIGVHVIAGSFVYLQYLFVSCVINDVGYLSPSFI